MKTVFSLLAVLMLGPCFGQTTYYVSTSGTNSGACTSGSPCATVQWVIDNKVLGPGDSILVGAGTWTDEPITFTAADDGDATGYVVLQGVDSASTIFDYFLGVTNEVHLNGANYIKVRNIQFDDASDDVVQISGGNNNIIENCWIRDGFDEVSIEASGSNTADNNVIRNNLLESDAFTYVDINGNNAGGSHRCDNNQVYDNVMRLMSGGNATPAIELMFADNTNIYRNRILGATRGIEIENTGGAGGTKIYNNYIKTTDDGIYNNGSTATSSNGELRHNSFYSARTCAYFRNISGDNVGGWDIRNNIFYTTATSSSEYCLRIEGSTRPDFCDNNQYYHPASARCARFNGSAYADLTGTGSTDWDEVDHSDEVGMTGDENAQQGDPLYLNPTSTGINALDLQASSPCYSNGAVLGIVDDIYLTSRPAVPAIGAFEDASALPIELLAFEVEKEEETVALFWRTATETNNHYFTIERSADGIEFEAIGEVAGAGNSQHMINYSYVDDAPFVGLIFYRIKQTDYDGTYSYSPLRTVEFVDEASTDWSLYPNPARLNGTITLTGAMQGAQVFNVAGQLMQTISFNESEQKRIQLDHRISGGVYFIVVQFADGTTDTQKFVCE